MNRYIRNCLLLAAIFASVVGVGPTTPQAAQAQAGTWYVSNSGSDANTCNTPAAPCATIQAAVDKAASGDTVRVATGIYTGTTSYPVADILFKGLKLLGGWDLDFATQMGLSTIDGENIRQGVRVYSLQGVELTRFHIRRGRAQFSSGAGIWNDHSSVLTVTESAITENTIGEIGTLGGNKGGGIFNNGFMAVKSSLIADNISIYNRDGSAIANVGVLTVTNSTISGNRGSWPLFQAGWQSSISIHSATIVNNDGVIYDNGGFTRIGNSIVANNGSGECFGIGTVFSSDGYNLFQGTQGCAPNTNDLTNIDPKLGLIQDNGGPTLTFALLSESPAIDGGNPAGCMGTAGILTTDQRGAPRLGRCDIGAFETNISLTKQVAGDYKPNGSITYTIAVRNLLGGMSLTNSILTDTLPPTIAHINGTLTASNGSASYDNGVISWTGDVLPSTPTIIQFGAVVNSSAHNTVITNTVIGGWSGFKTSASAVFDTFARVYLPITARNYCADFFDDFSNSFSGWPTGESDFVLAHYLNGEYRVQSKQPFLFLFRSPACERDNYVVEADMRWDGTASSDIGLLFGVMPNFSQYYFVTIDTKYQVYAIFRRNSNGTFSFVAPWAQTGSIHPGTQLNHLKVTRNGGQITLEINGVVIGSWFDSTITGPTRTGLAMAPYEDAPIADARFDNFRVTTIGAGTLGLPTLAPNQTTNPGQPLPADFQWRQPEHEWVVTPP